MSLLWWRRWRGEQDFTLLRTQDPQLKMFLNPAPYLDHGVLGGFILVLLVGIGLGFRLINRLIDTLQCNSKEQVSALLSVEKAVKESIDRAEHRHHETLSTFLNHTQLLSETREAIRRWMNGKTVGD